MILYFSIDENYETFELNDLRYYSLVHEIFIIGYSPGKLLTEILIYD